MAGMLICMPHNTTGHYIHFIGVATRLASGSLASGSLASGSLAHNLGELALLCDQVQKMMVYSIDMLSTKQIRLFHRGYTRPNRYMIIFNIHEVGCHRSHGRLTPS